MRVSIIIATFNAAGFLPACLRSIKEQSFKDFEVIIMDGGSSDTTLELIKAFDGAPCCYKSEPDKGIYDAFNKALAYASGEWYFFLGADDILMPGFSDMARHLTENDTLYYGDYLFKEKREGKKYSFYLLAKRTYCHQAIFYPAHVFNTIRYPEHYPVAADYAINLWCWGSKSLQKQYFPFLIVDYYPGGMSSFTKDQLFIKDKPSLVRKHLGLFIYLRYCLKKFKESRKRTDFF